MMGNTEIVAWVREHGKVVPSKLWKVEKPTEPDAEPDAEPAGPGPGGPGPDEPGPGDPAFNPARMFRRMRAMTQIYDLRPELGIKETPAP